jgi:hypothetical protein
MELRARASLGHAHTAACPTATSRLGSHRPPSEQIADVFERRRIDAGNVTLPWIERGRRPGGMKRCRPDIPQLVSHRLRGWNFYNPGGPGGSAFGATNEGGPLGGGGGRLLLHRGGLGPGARRAGELGHSEGPQAMTDDRPLTLQEAAELYRLKISTLRAESARGRLDVFRIGRRDYTTLESLKSMVRKCQEDARRRASTSTQDASNGSSATEQASSARAALNTSVTALRSGLPSISGRSTRRNLPHPH